MAARDGNARVIIVVVTDMMTTTIENPQVHANAIVVGAALEFTDGDNSGRIRIAELHREPGAWPTSDAERWTLIATDGTEWWLKVSADDGRVTDESIAEWISRQYGVHVYDVVGVGL